MTTVNNLYRYSMYCETEAKYVVTVLGATGEPAAPTQCPNDGAHVVAADSVRLLRTTYPDDVNVNENERYGTDAWLGFRVDTVKLQTDTGDLPKVLDVVYPVNMCLYSTAFEVMRANVGDRLCVDVAPDTFAGPALAAVAPGATRVAAAPATLRAVMIGYMLTLSEGGNRDELGRVLEVDWAAGELVFETPTTQAFTTAAALLVTRRFCDISFVTEQRYTLGADVVGGSFFPKGVTLRLSYYNVSTGPKSLNFVVEYSA